jgi:predicted AAA+ superfamily ATPase
LTQLILGCTAQEVNAANIASGLGITADTVRSYLGLTETIYLHHQLPAWTGGHAGRK